MPKRLLQTKQKTWIRTNPPLALWVQPFSKYSWDQAEQKCAIYVHMFSWLYFILQLPGPSLASVLSIKPLKCLGIASFPSPTPQLNQSMLSSGQWPTLSLSSIYLGYIYSFLFIPFHASSSLQFVNCNYFVHRWFLREVSKNSAQLG